MAFQKSLVFFICQCITTIVAVDALSFVSYTTYINSNSEKDVQCIQFDFRKISFISLELSDQSLHSLPRLCSPSTPDGEYRSGLWLNQPESRNFNDIYWVDNKLEPLGGEYIKLVW